jgi:acetyl esterase/lipase
MQFLSAPSYVQLLIQEHIIFHPQAKLSDILDPINQDFVKKLSQGPPLHEKTPQEAREIAETLQKHTPAADISQAKIDIPFDGRKVQTVIFKPKIAQGTLPVIFYTHGGGWILGRYNKSTSELWINKVLTKLAPLSMGP